MNMHTPGKHNGRPSKRVTGRVGPQEAETGSMRQLEGMGLSKENGNTETVGR